ncbi:MAG: PIG-L deacetylase family protein [Chloroflexota bacterium]|nr:PIG-L deacetylase family protein [Chloroflexota bacterium]
MKVLVFSAHCADFCSRAGGTIAKYVRKGDAVRVVVLSYGERSESGGLYAGGAKPALEEVGRIRHEEATRVASILGAEIRFLDWGDLSFDYSADRAKRLADEIRSFQPDVMLTHHGPDLVSVDHDTTWRLAARATQMARMPGLESVHAPSGPAPLFLFEATVPLTELEGFNPDFYVDVTDVWKVKLEALEVFRPSQGFLASWYTDLAKRRAFQARTISGQSGIEYAEAFERTRPWVGTELPLDGR